MKGVAVIPEPHLWDKNISSRKDYFSEMSTIMGDVEKKLDDKGDIDIIIFPGDVFHMGFVSSRDCMLFWIAWFYRMSKKYKIFCVIGNHEITYSKNNPFWKIAKMSSSIIGNRGESYMELFTVVDTLDVEGIKIGFEHYGTKIEDNCDIVVSHNVYMNPLIERMLREQDNRSLRTFDYRDVAEVKGMRILVVGHLHTAYGEFRVDREDGEYTLIKFLGSLGRTDVSQVNDFDLNRDVFCIYVNGDEIARLDNIAINLPPFAECCDLTAVSENRNEYELRKERVAEAGRFFLGTDPVEDVLKSLSSDIDISVMEAAILGTDFEWLNLLEKEVENEQLTPA
jgi:hypothetical protein